MPADLKSRWIVVGCCWMAVFVLTLWNLNKIGSIAKAIEKKQVFSVSPKETPIEEGIKNIFNLFFSIYETLGKDI